MKKIIVYSSQTGFTKKYAEWIAEAVGADLMPIKEAKKSRYLFDAYETIIYGGWCMGGKVVDLEWFTGRISGCSGKKVAVFAVGATPADAPEIKTVLNTMLTSEHKEYISTFYMPGGLNYEKMNFLSKMMMKAFASSLSKKKDLSDTDKAMAQTLLSSYDISDKKYISAIIDYINE